MHMVAGQGSDFCKVAADILVANNANALNSWWNLIRVLNERNTVIVVHVPNKPVIRNSLPLSVTVGIVAIGIVAEVLAIVVVVAIHRSTNIFFVGLVGKMTNVTRCEILICDILQHTPTIILPKDDKQ